jgi:protein-L-isoaspartate O-methyltransferase
VNAYFRTESSCWKSIYAEDGVYAEIHRNRQATALVWIDSLALSSSSKVLEVGYGAGFMYIALPKRGFRVESIDSVEAMVEKAHRNVEEVGVANLLSLSVGDVFSLVITASRTWG